MTKPRIKDGGKGQRGQPARMRLAMNLRELRTASGYSQEALAEEANFHRTFVSQVERGMNNISIDNIDRLSAALGVDIVDLLKRNKD